MPSDWIVIVEPTDPKSAEQSFANWTEKNPEWFGRLEPEDILKDIIRALDGSTQVRYRVRRTMD